MIKSYKKIGDTLWMHINGRTFTQKSAAESTSKGGSTRSSAAGHGGVLRSPMPGKILKVNFKTGDKVKSGQTVCIIEAMKMEYALKAPFDGVVKTIAKKSGDLVALDEKITEIDSSDVDNQSAGRASSHPGKGPQ